MAQQRLNAEHPGGDPATPFNELAQQNITGKIAALVAGGEQGLADGRRAVMKSLGDTASALSFPHSAYSSALGRLPHGGEIHAALMGEAEVAVNALVPNPAERRKQLDAIGADRQLLETYAAKGRAMAAYAARKKALGL